MWNVRLRDQEIVNDPRLGGKYKEELKIDSVLRVYSLLKAEYMLQINMEIVNIHIYLLQYLCLV